MTTANEKSRGYYKIKGAASAFNFDFKNKVVLDIGSSTGGFTEYALEKGALKELFVIEDNTNCIIENNIGSITDESYSTGSNLLN